MTGPLLGWMGNWEDLERGKDIAEGRDRSWKGSLANRKHPLSRGNFDWIVFISPSQKFYLYKNV